MSQTQTTAIPTIGTEELQARLEQGGAFQFWNVLTPEYFKNELIPGSLHVPLDRIGREMSRLQLSKDAEIVVYCAGPTCPQSRQAAEKLITLGYANVRAYEEGLEGWKRAGYAVTHFTRTNAAA